MFALAYEPAAVSGERRHNQHGQSRDDAGAAVTHSASAVSIACSSVIAAPSAISFASASAPSISRSTARTRSYCGCSIKSRPDCQRLETRVNEAQHSPGFCVNAWRAICFFLRPQYRHASHKI